MRFFSGATVAVTTRVNANGGQVFKSTIHLTDAHASGLV
jgi:hypothetical protein